MFILRERRPRPSRSQDPLVSSELQKLHQNVNLLIATWLPFGSVSVPVVVDENTIVAVPRLAVALAWVQLLLNVGPPPYWITVPWDAVVEVIEPVVSLMWIATTISNSRRSPASAAVAVSQVLQD